MVDDPTQPDLLAQSGQPGLREILKANEERNAILNGAEFGPLTEFDKKFMGNQADATRAFGTAVSVFEQHFKQTLDTLTTSQNPIECAKAMVDLEREVYNVVSVKGIAEVGVEFQLANVQNKLLEIETHPKLAQTFSRDDAAVIAKDLAAVRSDIAHLAAGIEAGSRLQGPADRLVSHLKDSATHVRDAMNRPRGMTPGTAVAAADVGPLSTLTPGQTVHMSATGPAMPAQTQDRGQAR